MNISDTIFQDLDTQYTSIIEKGQKPYLVVSSAGIPLFKSYSSSLYLLFDRTMGVSFDLTKSLPKIRTQMVQLVTQELSPKVFAQLQVALKVLVVSQALTTAVWEKSQGTSRASMVGKELEEITALFVQVFGIVAEYEKKSPVQVALEHNNPQVAFALIASGHLISAVPHEELKKLIPVCFQRGDYALFLRLLKMGITMPLPTFHTQQLVQHAVDAKDEAGIERLIDLKVHFHDTPMKRLIQASMTSCIKRLLASGSIGTIQQSTLKGAYTLIANSDKKPVVQVALEYNNCDIAYLLIHDKNPIVGIPKEQLQKLVPKTLQMSNDDLILQLLHEGVTVPLEKRDLPRLGFKCIETYNEMALVALIGLELDCSVKDNNGTPLVCLTALNGMHDALQKIIEKKISLYATDKDERTVLHYAFSSRNVPLCKAVLKYVDPTLQDKNKHTPLQRLLMDNSVTNSEKVTFIQELLERDRTCSYIALGQDRVVGSLKLNSLGVDLFEVLFLLGEKIPSDFMNRDEFEVSCYELAKVYSPKYAMNFLTSHFRHNTVQFGHGVELFRAGPPPKDVLVADILTLYKGLKLEESSPEVPGLLSATKIKTFAEVASWLETLVDRIVKRTPFDGTPNADTPALELFYDQIETHVKHTMKALKDLDNPVATLFVLKEYACVAPQCGGRYYSIALEQYLRICHGQEATPVAKLYKSVAEYRGMCLLNAVCALSSDNNVHNHNRSLSAFGEKYGIPGYEQARLFQDKYIGENYDLVAFEKGFLGLYTPQQLILEWLFPILKSDGEFRELYLDWHKEHIPYGFEREKFDKISKDLSQVDEDEQEEVLKKYDIFLVRDQSVEDAVNGELISLYLEQFVYRDNELSLEALLYCLERMGVITSELHWSEKQKVRNVQYVEDALYRKPTFFSKFCSFISSVNESIVQLFN